MQHLNTLIPPLWQILLTTALHQASMHLPPSAFLLARFEPSLTTTPLLSLTVGSHLVNIVSTCGSMHAAFQRYPGLRNGCGTLANANDKANVAQGSMLTNPSAGFELDSSKAVRLLVEQAACVLYARCDKQPLGALMASDFNVEMRAVFHSF